MLSLSFRQPVSASLLLEGRAGYSGVTGDFTALERDSSTAPPEQFLYARTFTRDLLAGLDATWYYGTHRFHLGIQSDNYEFDHQLEADSETDFDGLIEPFRRMNSARTLATYAEGELRIGNALDLRLGMRHLAAGSLGSEWLPRAGVRWHPGNSVALSASAGRYAQVLRSMRNDESVVSSLIAYDLLSAQADNAGLATSEEYTLGAEWTRGSSTLRIDGYQKNMRGLMLPPSLRSPLDMPVLTIDDYVIGSGAVRGVELLGSHRVGESTFMVSYALTRAKHRHPSLEYAPRFDRRHTLNATATLPVGGTGVFSTRVAWGNRPAVYAGQGNRDGTGLRSRDGYVECPSPCANNGVSQFRKVARVLPPRCRRTQRIHEAVVRASDNDYAVRSGAEPAEHTKRPVRRTAC